MSTNRGHNKWSFRSPAQGKKYLSAEPDGSIACDKTQCGHLETFQIEPPSDLLPGTYIFLV